MNELVNLLSQVGGHDKTSDDLRKFYNEFGRQRLEEEIPVGFDRMSRLRLEVERMFWSQFLLPELQKNKPFVFLSAFAHPVGTERLVGHEAHHARYITEPQYAKIINDYWVSMSEEDRKLFVGVMSENYAAMPNDPILAANEFQAYNLQPDSYQALSTSSLADLRAIAPLVLKHRQSLERKILGQGLKLLEVKAKFEN